MHPLLSILSTLAQLFIVSGAISNCLPLFPRSLLDSFQPEGLIFWCHTFCLFILFMGFSRQEYWSGLWFPPPVDHVLSEFFTLNHLSWAGLHSMVHSFTELHKLLHHNKAVIHEGDLNTTKYWKKWGNVGALIHFIDERTEAWKLICPTLHS